MPLGMEAVLPHIVMSQSRWRSVHRLIPCGAVIGLKPEENVGEHRALKCSCVVLGRRADEIDYVNILRQRVFR